MVFHIDDSGAVPAEDDHRSSEEVLVSVDRQCPELAFLDDCLGDELKTHATSLVGRVSGAPRQADGQPLKHRSGHPITASDNPLGAQYVAPHRGPTLASRNRVTDPDLWHPDQVERAVSLSASMIVSWCEPLE